MNGLRGGAVLFILMYHALVCIDTTQDSKLDQVIYLVAAFGFTGVNLLFVLSTFLLTHSLWQKETLADYYLKRSVRWLPAYVVFGVVVCLFLRVWSPTDAIPHVYEPLVATFTVNFLPAIYGAEPPGWYWIGHLWSIAVGVQVLLFWPFLVRWLSVRGLGFVCVLLVAGSWGFRIWLLNQGHNAPYPEPIVFFHTLSNLDSFATGGLLACAACRWHLLEHFSPWWQPLGWLLVVVAGGLMLTAPDKVSNDYRVHSHLFTIVALMYAAFIAAALTQRTESWLVRYFNSPMLQWVGKYSLGIYLYHWPILALLKQSLHPRFLAWGSSNLVSYVVILLLSFSISLLLGMLSWHLVEHPCLRRIESGETDK